MTHGRIMTGKQSGPGDATSIQLKASRSPCKSTATGPDPYRINDKNLCVLNS